MENISKYLAACTAFGVPDSDLFRSVDLHEGKDMRAVVRNLHSLGRVAQGVVGFNGPHLGARLATKSVRRFSQAQLDEAKAMPSRWTTFGEARSMPSRWTKALDRLTSGETKKVYREWEKPSAI
jgi:hypothetical protein